MRQRVLTAVAVCLCIAAAASCKPKAQGPQGAGTGTAKVKPATTPEQTLKNMQAALLAGDREAFVECFDAAGQQAAMLGAVAEFAGAGIRFREAMEKAYGADALKGGQGMGADQSLEAWKQKNVLEGASLKVEGDTAAVTVKGQPTPLQMVRVGGVWKIRADEFLHQGATGGGQDAEMAAKVMGAMTGVLKGAMAKIGQPGYTAEKINREVSAATMAAMMEIGREKAK